MSGGADEAAATTRRLLGGGPAEATPLAGRVRGALRVRQPERSVIATHRSPRRAALEAGVLRELAAAGAPVPRLLAAEGRWLLQEDLGGAGLAQALAAARDDPARAAALLYAAADTLARIQAAAARAGLARRVVRLGLRRDWLARLIETPARIGAHLDLPAPALDGAALAAALRPPRLGFVKWDARPANAILQPDGSFWWIDWEHCGCRDPADDLAWLLGDEYAPDLGAAEAPLLSRLLPRFAAGRSPADAGGYLAAFSTLHMTVRLALILRHKGDGAWWDAADCLARDRVGVTAGHARGLCAKAARWAPRHPLTAPLGPWFASLQGRLATLA